MKLGISDVAYIDFNICLTKYPRMPGPANQTGISLPCFIIPLIFIGLFLHLTAQSIVHNP